MSVRKLTTDGDWTWGQGRANYISNSAEIAQNVSTRIKSFKNDWFLDTGKNIDWFAILGNYATEQTMRREIERVTIETDGVKSIEKLDIVVGTDRKATINIEYTDIYNKSFRNEIGLP